jgi:hypothetical protein
MVTVVVLGIVWVVVQVVVGLVLLVVLLVAVLCGVADFFDESVAETVSCPCYV